VRLPLPSKFCAELVERPSQIRNGSTNLSAFQADILVALFDFSNVEFYVLGHAAEIARYLVYVRRYPIPLSVLFSHVASLSRGVTERHCNSLKQQENVCNTLRQRKGLS
jgi:hypothetical protein